MKITNFAEANNDLKAVLDFVDDSGNVVTIKRSNTENAVVMSLRHYDSLMETLYLLKSPVNAAHLAKSIAQYKDGKTSIRALV